MRKRNIIRKLLGGVFVFALLLQLNALPAYGVAKPEAEFNNDISNANLLNVDENGNVVRFGFHGSGDTDNNNDAVDYWQIDGLANGLLVFLSVEVDTLPGSQDSILRVLNSDGPLGTIIFEDDDEGDGLGSAEAFQIQDGNLGAANDTALFLEISDFGNDEPMTYFLRFLVADPVNDVDFEVEPNNDVANATPITNLVMEGDLNIGEEEDFYSFFAPANQTVSIFVNQNPGIGGGVTVDNVNVELLDTDGSSVLELLSGVGEDDEALHFTVTTAGQYFIRVFNEDNPYHLAVTVDDIPASQIADPRPLNTIQFSSSIYSVLENDPNNFVVIELTREGDPQGQGQISAQVNLTGNSATGGVDYEPNSLAIDDDGDGVCDRSFNPNNEFVIWLNGETFSKHLCIGIFNDNDIESLVSG